MHSQLQTFNKNKYQILGALEEFRGSKSGFLASFNLLTKESHTSSPMADLPLAPLKQDGGGLDRGFWFAKAAKHCKRGLSARQEDGWWLRSVDGSIFWLLFCGDDDGWEA